MTADTNPGQAKMAKAPRITFGPVSCCIYCGKEGDLRTEHIIPFGLGGNLELLKGSCADCGTTTSRFEMICLRETFNNLRVKYGVQTRRPERRKRAFPIWVERLDGTSIEEAIGPEELPLHGWALPLLDTPSFASQIAPDNRTVLQCQLETGDAEAALAHGDGHSPVSINLGRVDLQSFARMLAKIAHSYAYAILPKGSFQPCLNKLILEGDEGSLLSG